MAHLSKLLAHFLSCPRWSKCQFKYCHICSMMRAAKWAHFEGSTRCWPWLRHVLNKDEIKWWHVNIRTIVCLCQNSPWVHGNSWGRQNSAYVIKKKYIYVSANPQKTRDSFPVCQNVTSNGREGGIESALASFRGESGWDSENLPCWKRRHAAAVHFRCV
jgi:hypothetical protein